MRTHSIVGLLVGASLIVAACGDDAPATSEASAETTAPAEEAAPAATTAPSTMPMTTPMTDAPESVPSAIVSMSPTATEMIYAIGAGDLVIAVDDLSNYPPEAAEKMVGLSAWEPSVEAIADLNPDLVLNDGTNPDLLAQLDTLGIPHWEGMAASTFDDVYAQIEQLGAATDHVGDAAELVASMQTEIDAITASVPELDEPLTFYHELDPTYYSVTSDTFIGAVYGELGLVNIADAVGDATPYPQLSAEFIVEQDPDLIFLACTDLCQQSADTVADRPGWDILTAVQTESIFEVDMDIASRWGPRIVDYMDAVAAAINDVAARQPSS